MKKLSFTMCTAFVTMPLIWGNALAQEEAQQELVSVAASQALEHRHMESSVFFSCDAAGVCTEELREVRSNVSEQETKRRYELDQKKAAKRSDKELADLAKATIKALKKAEKLTQVGADDASVDVVIYLPEKEFNLKQLRGLRKNKDKAAFSQVVENRKSQLSKGQEKLEKIIQRKGGEVKHKFVLTNMISASIPASAIAELVGESGVLAIELDAKTTNDADGIERRNALGLPSGGISGLDGGQGSTNSNDTEVLFGVIEAANALNTSHLSFLDWSGGPSNIIDTDSCNSSSCSGTSTTTSATHGTLVTSVLMGSIEQGQNPNITDTNDRRRRSGIAIEAHGRYYNAGGFLSGTAQAIEDAVIDGVDIINMSLSPDDDYCSNDTLSGVRAEARAATDAGVLVVVTAGNDADDLPAGTCSVSSIGAIPDTLTVGATDDVTNLASMDSVDLADYSGRGTTSVTLDGGRSLSTRFVDLIVTGDADLGAGSGTTGTQGNVGTSFAAPQVAGVAGLLKDWVNDRGSFGGMEDDPYALRTLLSVMGDGVSSTAGGGSGFGFSVSDHSGFGHLRFVNLDNELGGGGGWGLQRRFMTEGQVVEWSVWDSGPESSSVNGWKFAALWDWNVYGGSPDIKFELVDKCPSGGGETVVRTAARHPLKARIRMRGSEMSSLFHGRCLWMRATVEHATGTVPVYTADYFYTNARSNHDMP